MSLLNSDRPDSRRLSRATAPGRPSRRRPTIALVGADGAGKSTITRRLSAAPLSAPVKTIYMGVNLEASSVMLPTTRLLLAIKRARGGRPDLVASRLRQPDDPSQGEAASHAERDEPTDGSVTQADAPARSGRANLKDGLRMAVWMAEEWLRQGIAAFYVARGFIVVFDRHFFADYYHADISRSTAQDQSRRSPSARLHGWMLQHLYPQPGVVICLDAPADVLFRRKPEASIAWLDQRRQQYLDLAEVVSAFTVVDADRDLDLVFADVVHTIENSRKESAA